MANPNNPFGFIPVKHLNGGDCTQTQTMRLASGYNTSIFTGDPVKLVSGEVQRCGATDAADGIFVGCHYTDENGAVQFSNTWKAGTVTKGTADAEARVISDKQVVYMAQFTGTPSVSDIGSVFTLAPTAGNVDGRSKVGVTTTKPDGVYKLYDFLEDSENEVGQYVIGLFTLA